MTRNSTGQATKEVRRQAEQRVQKTPTNVTGMSADEIGRLLYELEVHQEELKIQNEELRRVQLDLESSRASLADLYDFAPVGYLSVDANGLIIQANLATATMLGQERSKIVGARLAQYCDPGSRIKLHDHLERVLTTKTSQCCELKFATPQGATFDISLHSNHAAARGTGDDWQYRLIMTDISREKAAEALLRASEERYRRLVENSPFSIHEMELDAAFFEQAAVGVAQLDSISGVILRVNRRYGDILSTPAQHLLGKTWMELTHPDDLAADLDKMVRLHAGEIRDFSMEKRLVRPDGSYVWANLTVSPMWQPGEEPSTHIAIIEDITERKDAEAGICLRDHAFASSSHGIVIVDATQDDLPIIYCNPAFKKMTGYSDEEVLGRNCRFLQGQDRDQPGQAAIREALQSGEEVSATLRNCRKDGTKFWCELHISPVRDANGRLTHFLGFQNDVTERVQAESERVRLLDILQRSLNEIYVFDSETLRFEYVNAGALRNLGYSLDEMHHMAPFDIKPDLTESTFRELIAPLRSAEQELLRFETVHQRADGSRYPVEVNLQLIRQGSVEVFLAVVLDITERRRQEHQYRAIVETTQEWIWEMDLQGVQTYSNPAMMTLLGYSEDDLVGGNVFDLMHEDDREVAERELPRRIAQQEGWTGWVLRWRHKDGSIRYLESNANPLLDENGNLIGFRGADRDVTARIAAEESLRLSEERYRSLVTASAATIWIANPEGGFSYPQPMWEAFTGQPWQEHQDLGWTRMLHPDDAERMTSSWREVVDDPQRFLTAGRIFHAATGQYRYCEVHATPLINPDGSVREWFGITIDVHEHKLAEFALATRNEMLEAIRSIQAEFVAGDEPGVTFDKLLAVLLKVTSGEYGFIGAVLQDDGGVPFLKTYSITNVAWDEATRKFYDELAPAGLEFRNLENLFGTVITSGRAVITNDPANDPRSGGLPPGHPPLRTFMGLPIYSQHEMIGMVGVANCPDGIAKEQVHLLEPFLATCGNLIQAYSNERNRLKAEEVVRDNARSLAMAQRIAQMGSWELDLATGQLTGSAEMLRLLGLPETGQLPTMDSFLSEFVPLHNIEEIARLYQTASTSGVAQALEFRFRRRSDQHVCFGKAEAEVINGQDGSPQRIIGTFQDVTEKRQVELALRESEEKFRVLTERSPAAVLIARQDQIVYCNSALSAITGYSREELLRMPLREVVHPDFRESIADRQRRRLNGEDVPGRYDSKIVTKSGQERWLDISAELIEFEDAPAVLVTCVNVTERKLAEQALKRSEETLRELNASLEDRVAARTAELTDTNAELAAFAHTVSHDLRAPLRAMEGFAAALAEDYGQQLDQDARQFIQHIIDSAKRMDALINDLLVFSRLGRTGLHLKAIRLDAVVAEAQRQLNSEIEACHAQLDISDRMPKVLGHKATLVQVVANLLSNAMKFVAEGVQPQIRAWTERQDSGMMRLWVEDNGIGIDDTYRDRIFRAFERLHGIESYPGTGIGLAIVARACERLGGRYGFESQCGQGSRFWVEFKEGDTNS